MKTNFFMRIKGFIGSLNPLSVKLQISGLFLLLLSPGLIHAADQTGLRGKRYCEIVLAKSLTRYEVYNTLGLGECPPAQWNKMSISQVKKGTKASFVYLNGPRYWVIDGFKNTSLLNKSIQTFQGMAMREAGLLNFKVADLLKASSPFYKHEVQRHTTWVYQAGKPIYELIAPNGEVFVMQSYSTKKLAQNESSLPSLGSKLKLPKGWVFKSGILTKPAVVVAVNDMAFIVQDNFDNTYQKASHDFLKG